MERKEFENIILHFFSQVQICFKTTTTKKETYQRQEKEEREKEQHLRSSIKATRNIMPGQTSHTRSSKKQEEHRPQHRRNLIIPR